MTTPQIKTESPIFYKEKKYLFSKTFSLMFLFLAVLLFFAARWYVKTFGNTGFDSIIFTLFVATEGMQAENSVKDFLLKGLLPSLIAYVPVACLLFFPFKKSLAFKKLTILPLKNWCACLISTLLSVIMLLSASNISGLTAYIRGMVTVSTIFEEKYVDPLSAKIEFPEKKQNLIYIFLESMETTYFSEDEGGAMETNLTPELYDLADKNINFSHNHGIGGFLTPSGTTWTVAAMTAHSSGVPLKSPPSFERNTYGNDVFLPGLNTLTNVLKKNGYYQALMVGSDSAFANRDVYYENHGIDKVYDLYTAQNDGIVPEGYHVWWGMEDKHLFEYAKKELTKISRKDEPFAFTMLTVDTHFTNGYVCSLCKNTHEEQYDNVISCSSKQVLKFVNWLKKQDFYKDTTIIIAGDHLTMDSEYIKRRTDQRYEQRVYNCIINSKTTTDNYKNRTFTSLDMFPTTLAAMGCKIEGDRLGLGTNLFSSKKTLAEEMGYKEFDKQLSMNSKYYNINFLNK